MMHVKIARRDFNCAWRDEDGECLSQWHYTRWIALGVVLFACFMLLVICFVVARRRRARGTRPIYGTQWMAPHSAHPNNIVLQPVFSSDPNNPPIYYHQPGQGHAYPYYPDQPPPPYPPQYQQGNYYPPPGGIAPQETGVTSTSGATSAGAPVPHGTPDVYPQYPPPSHPPPPNHSEGHK